jgi:Zn-finger nucleic acid-binding protein
MPSLLCKHCERPCMKCPACPDATLLMTDRQGVEIDYCAACRGVWLDRGELDKLLERAAFAAAPAPVAQNRKQLDVADLDYRGDQRYHRQRKKSWLNEIFD